MSKKDFIETAKKLHMEGEILQALHQIFSVLDGVAKRLYPNLSTSKRCKKFISTHFLTISRYGFPGIIASSISIYFPEDVEGLTLDNERRATMDTIIYCALRCYLSHEATVHPDIKFIDETIIGDWKNNSFPLPKNLIYGLIAAVELYPRYL